MVLQGISRQGANSNFLKDSCKTFYLAVINDTNHLQKTSKSMPCTFCQHWRNSWERKIVKQENLQVKKLQLTSLPPRVISFKNLILTLMMQSQEFPITLGHRKKKKCCEYMKAKVKKREHFSSCGLQGNFKADCQLKFLKRFSANV